MPNVQQNALQNNEKISIKTQPTKAQRINNSRMKCMGTS